MIRVLLTVCLFALAITSSAATARSEGGAVYVNEVHVLTLRAPVGGNSPAKRAQILADKLSKAASLDLSIRESGVSRRILLGQELIILVNRDEAKKQGASAGAVAARWVKNLREAWALPPVKLSRQQVVLPVGGQAAVPTVGSQARTAPVFVDPAVGSVTRKGATLTVKALAVGETTIQVGEGEATAALELKVLPYAASFPQSVSVNVVGAPASASTVRAAIEGAMKTSLVGLEGVRWTWTGLVPGNVPSAERRSYAVRVKATAPGAYAADGVVNVSVTNLGIAHRRESELWYCNEPERVQRPQSLFVGRLRQDEPVRLLYHHINDTPSPMYIRILARNTSSVPANVVIIPGDSKDKNPVLAGVLAADPFFRSWLAGSGEVVTLPPGASLPIAFRRLVTEETSSGLCYLRLLGGGPQSITVTAEALAPYPLDARWTAALSSSAPWREIGIPTETSPVHVAEHSDLVFPKPFKQEEFTYRAGGNFSFFRIGQRPIERRDAGKPLEGNFGVIYNIQAKAENPTQAPVNVELVFEASAGYSGALFALDGQFIRLPLLQPKAEARLARFRLEPGESRTMNLTTIPLSGSSYPATLVLRPVTNLPDLETPKR